ncbi:MAG: tetratricopeptide repeat protein [Pyrinomonadaceae bacterium]|nr:tetratricopeptide repeat protein [Pyrinomonadaceae bacterium]
MKKVFLFLLLTTLAFFQLNCTRNAANDSNQTNVNLAVAAETNQTNANVKPAETPLPTFIDADAALAEGKKLLDNLETEKAIDALSQAVKLNPDSAEAHFNLGIAYSLAEKLEEESAVTRIETTPTPKPTRKTKNDPAPRTKNSEKAFDNAVKAYKKILAKNPKDDVSHFNLGRAYNKLNEDEDALKAVKEAVKLKPEDYEYQTELGVILMKLAQYEEAVAALKKALNLDPTNLPAEDLLEKAEAGRKRVDFGNKPKPPPPPPEQSRPRGGNPKPKETNTAPKEEPKPETPNANQ